MLPSSVDGADDIVAGGGEELGFSLVGLGEGFKN